MLKLNDSKTEIIVFGTQKKLAMAGNFTVRIGEANITPATLVRNLGVIYDSALNMDKQITSICRVCNMHLHRLGRVRKYLTDDATKSLVNSTITSRLDYANGLLYGTKCSLISRLQRVQNSSARLITGVRRRDHISPTLSKLHWLPIQARIHYKILLQTYKALRNKAPAYITALINPHKPSRSLRSENANLLTVPRTITKTYGDRRFGAAAPKLWNNLPSPIRSATTVHRFKTLLKTHLFNIAYNS